MKKIVLAAALLPLMAGQAALAKDDSYLEIGIGGGFGTSPYVGYKNQWTALPSIAYENKYIYISGLSAGVKLWEAADESQSLTLDAYYLPREFRPNKSKNAQMKLLDKRKSTLMTGISYNIYTPYGYLENSFAYDAGGRTKGGITATSQYSFDWEVLPKLTIKPAVGLTYTNRKFNQYYYGVSEKESVRSGLKAYRAKAALQPHAELLASYEFNQKLSAFVGVRVQKLTGSVHHSPMIKNKYETETAFGVLYRFF